MASPLAHLAVGGALAAILAPRRAPNGYFYSALALALLPDLLLLFAGDWSALLTKPVAPELASSLPVALLLGAAISGLFRLTWGRPRFGHLNSNGHALGLLRGWLVFTLVFAGSATLNGLASQPLFYYWPLESAPYVDGIRWLPGWFPNPLRWQGLWRELWSVILPALLLAALVALLRERISAPHRRRAAVDLDETGNRLAR